MEMENMKKFISWRRVSTKKQGKTGLGLSAQQVIIEGFVEREHGRLIADYEEVYTGTHLSGCTELRKAIEHCKREGAILIIAKTDRFRNTVEALQVYEEMGENSIYFCDLPQTNKFMLTVSFAFAEQEALFISIRTKQALQAKKARGETWHRNSDTAKASRVSADNRIEDARNDQANLFFYKYWKAYAERNADKEKNKAYYNQLASELNALGQRTCKGLEYTGQIVQNRIVRMRQLYEGVERKKRVITA
jgi:DNA invertase Pin-like site-specific DNA recombinase